VEPALKYRWHRTVIVGWAPALNPLSLSGSHRWAWARALWGGTCSKISLASYCHCGVGSCSKSSIPIQLQINSITQQNQLQNKINHTTKSITQQNQLQNAQTQNQPNNKSIQYLPRINSIPTQHQFNAVTIITNSMQSNLHQFNE
jgi:hypothetical protein